MRKKIRLLSLSKNELKNVKGAVAGNCDCGCYYSDDPDERLLGADDYYGGSSTADNRSANDAGGLHSPPLEA